MRIPITVMAGARMKTCFLLFLCVSASVSMDCDASEQACNMSQSAAVSRKFAFSIYNTASQLMGHRRNLLVSPLAVGALLSMISHGASGRTRKEIFKVLKQGERSESAAEEELNNCVLTAYHANRFNRHFVLRDNPQHNTARLRTATRIFGDTNLTFDGDFVKYTGFYGTEMAVVPLSTDARQAERRINRWVYDQTNGNIRQIVKLKPPQESVNILTTCTMFFKGTWISPFLNATRDPFFLFNKRTRFTDFMTSYLPLNYLSSNELRAELVEIPYDVPDGSNIDPSLVLILPFEDTSIRQVEVRLNDNIIESLLFGNKTRQVKIRIPKFQFVGSQKLKFFLKRMGVRDVFSSRLSELSNALENGDELKDKLYISLSEHKVRFEVDEYGSQGFVRQAVVDERKVSNSTNDQILTFNRAYVFILYDKFTNTVVYIGRMSDPSRRL